MSYKAVYKCETLTTDYSWNWYTLTNKNSCTQVPAINWQWMYNSASYSWMWINSDLWINGSLQNWTFAIWYRPISTVSTQSVFASIYAEPNYIAYLEWYASNFRVVRLWSWANIAINAYTFTWWQWYYIVWTYDWTTITAYINWKKLANTASSTTNRWTWTRANAWFWWDSDYMRAWTNSLYWPWTYDEVIFDNTAWNAQKQKTMYSFYRGIF